MSDSLQPHELQHARLPCPSLSPRVCSHSCPLSWWCYLIISSSANPFSFSLQSFPASGSFPMSQLFASDDKSVGASASVLLMNIQIWFPSGLTSLISLKFKGLSRVFSSTTVQNHQFFGAQPSLWSNSHAVIMVHRDFGAQENKRCHCFHFFPSICHEVMGQDAMILVFWYCISNQLFHSPLSPSSRSSLVSLHFLTLKWYHLHIWCCWYFSRQS